MTYPFLEEAMVKYEMCPGSPLVLLFFLLE